MSSPKPISARCVLTRQRILDAAAMVFARDGLDGATTRTIAVEAGVNEVTLFRVFGSKEKLLSAVLGRTFNAAQGGARPALPQPTGDLRKNLTHFATLYESLLRQNLLLMRTLVGEIHRHKTQERKFAEGIFRPLRMELISRLRQEQEQGNVRSDVNVEVAADQLSAMIFTGVLRASTPHFCKDYSSAEYLESCVEVFARGIEPRKP